MIALSPSTPLLDPPPPKPPVRRLVETTLLLRKDFDDAITEAYDAFVAHRTTMHEPIPSPGDFRAGLLRVGLLEFRRSLDQARQDARLVLLPSEVTRGD